MLILKFNLFQRPCVYTPAFVLKVLFILLDRKEEKNSYRVCILVISYCENFINAVLIPVLQGFEFFHQ